MSYALSRQLENLTTSQSNFKNDYISAHTVYSETSINFPKFRSYDEISNSNIISNVKRNTKDDRRSHSRASATVSKLHIPNVHNKKVKRPKQKYFQFEIPEQIHKPQTFQSIPSSSDAQILASSGLDGKARSQSGLLSRANKICSQAFPTHELPGSATADDMFTLRPVSGAKNVRFYNKLDCRNAASGRYSSNSVSRRFFNCSPIQRPAYISCESNSEPSDQLRLDREHGKVDPVSNPGHRVPRNQMEHESQHKVVATRQSTEDPPLLIESSRSRQLVPQAGSMSLRVSELCNFRHPPGKVALPRAAASLQSIAQKHFNISEIPRRSSKRAGVVDGEYNTRDSNPSRINADKLYYHRRFRTKMGSTSQQQSSAWNVASTSENLALQYERDVCSDSGHIIRGAQTDKLPSYPAKRQQNRSCLSETRRRNQIPTVVRADQATASTNGQPQHCVTPLPPPWEIQHGSRSPVAKPRRLRVAPVKRSSTKSVRPMGNSVSRSVRIKKRPCSSNVCYARLIRLERLLSRRLQQILAVRTGLGVPATQHNTTSFTAPELGDRAVYHCSTQVEETLLETRPKESCPDSTIQNTGPEIITGRHSDGPSPSTNPTSGTGSLACFGWDSLTGNWSRQEKDLLSSCWRGSTLKTYTPIWNKWSAWCLDNNINFRKPAPSDVARYLAYLFLSEKLAYRTILVYKSVISSICETLNETKISCSPIVKHVLKAISLAKPLPPKVPVWDARVLIKYLRETSPNQNSLYDVSRRTAALLLLSSGRRVHDLTLLHCSPDRFIDDNGNSITLHPIFGSKTDSASFQQSSWTLSACSDRNLDPIFWLRKLVSISKDTRGSLPNLFITSTRPVKPATATIIGGWLKRLLSEAGIQASPGSFRSAVSSLNWIENYPINEILAKANWRHESTFRRHYQRPLQSTQSTDRTDQSLSQLFSVS